MPKCRHCGAQISLPADPTIDEATESIIVNGERRHLTHKEWDLFSLLYSRANRIVPKDFIVSYIYGATEPNSNTLDVFLWRTKRKLEGSPYRIKNSYGRGYWIEKKNKTAGG
jgi:DNA-binding response OmpR family regulator